MVISVLLVNLRYLLMSSAMSVFFREHTTVQKILSGLLLTDETFGVAVQYGGAHSKVPFAWMLGINVAAWLNWILACIVGAGLASRRRLLETVAIAVSVLITLFMAGHTDTSVVVIVAASVSATLATLGLRLFAKGEQ